MIEKSRKIAFWCYFTAVSVWTALYLLLNNKTDWDLWGVMSFGAWLNQAHQFPYRDPFSYTAYLKPWVYHEWGSGVVFYQLFKYWGSPALFWLKLLLVEGMWLLAGWRVIFQKERSSATIFPLFFLNLLLAAYLILPMVSNTLRCHIFTFVLYTLFLLILQGCQTSHKRTCQWLLPPLMLLWVNLHGGFIAGLAAVGVYALHALYQAQKQKDHPSARSWLILLSACGLATLINPYGFRFIQTMIEAWALPRSGISEWGNVFTLAVPAYGLLYSGMLLFWLTLAIRYGWKHRSPLFPPALLIVLTGLYGWLHYKLAPLFLITVLAIGFELVLESWLNFWENFTSKKLTISWRVLGILGNFVLPILLVVLALVPMKMYLNATPHPFHVRVQGDDTLRTNTTISRYAYPIGAVDFMRQSGLKGNLWAPFAWGEYLYWSLYPNIRVSIDGRYETIYPQSVYKDTEAFYHPPFPLEKADLYPTTHILISTQTPAQASALIKKMDASHGWRLIYADTLSRLYARADQAASAPVAPPRSNGSRLLDDYPAEFF